MKTIACNVHYGSGGLGQHFSHVVEEARNQDQLERYYTSRAKPGDEAIAHIITLKSLPWLFKYTPVRFSPGWKNHLGGDLFDRAVARQLTGPIDTYLGFGGQSLHAFRRAKKLGCRKLELLAANSHVNNVVRQHVKALALYPFETTWLNETQRKKTIEEYAMADVILVASEYTRQSFIDEGVSASKLQRLDYVTDPRFKARPPKTPDGVFRIVYTGSVTAVKGVPVLIEAFSKLKDITAELILVGGTAASGMRRFMTDAIKRDPRIRLCPGDPLPYLQTADVQVHPSWEDGYSYAPMEAMACGVPVIVTEDTGMKDHVREGVNGYMVPTGNSDAIFERLQLLASKRKV